MAPQFHNAKRTNPATRGRTPAAVLIGCYSEFGLRGRLHHHYLKARHALALFLRGLSPEFTGLFPALRIQGGHRSVHFHPAAPLNSSLFSVCAKVVLRIIEKFSERRRGAVCAVFRLPVAHRFKCRPRRLARLPPVSESQPDNAAITARCASQSSGSSR